MSSLKPPALAAGDLIRIVTPASPLTAEKLSFAIQLLESQGYRVDVATHALEADAYLAGTDEQRANDLQSAFDDPEVKAVYCSRGGYGCARLLPYLDLDRMAQARKLFIGFSDITTLHLALNRRGLPTLHGPMPLTLNPPREPWVIESLLLNLKGNPAVPAGAPAGTTMVGGTAEGQVVGGCLCLLTDSLGTPEALDCRGKILIIEDVDENPHRIDAMLTHLLNEGTIYHAAGIVIGEMTRSDERCDEGIGGKPWREIVRDRLAHLGLPLIVDFPFGHAAQMLTLPLGIRARLDADAGTLTYLESPCES
jgi:muramoyltetrapeptide carboxypeptidase